ncbi:hypothetical protein [Microcoleus sp. PH2017_22_RUC_O_B]|nr:hypothetical protein [Microcoleus sp. PH2017_22_RUC_O_B]
MPASVHCKSSQILRLLSWFPDTDRRFPKTDSSDPELPLPHP